MRKRKTLDQKKAERKLSSDEASRQSKYAQKQREYRRDDS